MMTLPTVLTINVGGTLFTTLRSTLCRIEDSMLASMFSGRHEVAKDSDGHTFIDADPACFEHILRYLRREVLPVVIVTSTPNTQSSLSGLTPNDAWEVYREALYFGIDPLVSHLRGHPCVFNRIVRERFASDYPECKEARDTLVELAMQKMDHFHRTVAIDVHYEKLEEAKPYRRPIDAEQLEKCDEECDADLIMDATYLESMWGYQQPRIVSDLCEDGFKVKCRGNTFSRDCRHTCMTLEFSL